MLINPIASGSSGNAYYISDGQSSLLLDAGIPLAQIQAGCGYKVSQLSGCLVTHGHGDHVKAAKALARMAGGYGTGKTHLAAAIANQLISEGTACICMTMIDLLDRIRETYKAAGSDVDEAYILSQYEDVPLLIIDDIGSEQPTEWGVSKIFAIINARYEGYMPTIITTNYSGPELVQRMTPESGDSRNAEKTLDRLKETCVGIDMTWESWRAR